LDTREEDWQDVIERAPQLTEYLGDAAREHFEHVQLGLARLGIPFELAPRLVRGFDYYTSTTFEFASDALDAAQNAIGGGGRYDQLAEEMGGPATPGIGFGLGIERLLIARESEADVHGDDEPLLDAFVIDSLHDGTLGALVHSLREAGLRADRAFDGRPVKAQWKLADRAQAAYGVMLAGDEATRGMVVVKDLKTTDQVEVPRAEIAAWLLARREERRR
jgi:histidyl-tRNA synthetase